MAHVELCGAELVGKASELDFVGCANAAPELKAYREIVPTLKHNANSDIVLQPVLLETKFESAALMHEAGKQSGCSHDLPAPVALHEAVKQHGCSLDLSAPMAMQDAVKNGCSLKLTAPVALHEAVELNGCSLDLTAPVAMHKAVQQNGCSLDLDLTAPVALHEAVNKNGCSLELTAPAAVHEAVNENGFSLDLDFTAPVALHEAVNENGCSFDLDSTASFDDYAVWTRAQMLLGTFTVAELLSRIDLFGHTVNFYNVIHVVVGDLVKEELKPLARSAGIPFKQAGKRLSADDLRQQLMHSYFSQTLC